MVRRFTLHSYRYPVTPVARWRQSIEICVFARAADIPPMASWPRPPMAPSPRRLVVPGPPIASRAHQTNVSVPDLCDAPRWSHRGGWPSTPNWSRGPRPTALLRSARTWWKAPSVRSWIASRHARPCSTWGRPPISYGGGGTSRNQGRSGGQVRPRVQPTALLVGAVGPLPHGVRGPLRRNGGTLDRHIQEVRPRTAGLTGSTARTGRSCEQGALRTRSFFGTHFGDFGNLVPQHGRSVLSLVLFV